MSKDTRPQRSDIPELTTRRLSIYLRCLKDLETAGVKTVSSREIADRFHLNSAQFRKDLAYFGEFGKRGQGYQVTALKQHLIRILGLDRKVRLAIVGAGNLGTALADYPGFNGGSFQVVAMFDCDPDKIGTRTRRDIQVRDVAELTRFVAKHPVDIAVLAVPAAAGQVVLDQVAAAGVQTVLNFVPTRLKVPDHVRLKSVDLKVQVEALVFHLARHDQQESVPMSQHHEEVI